MNIVLLESLGIPDSLLDGYRASLESRGHSFTAYGRCDDIDTLKSRVADAEVIMLANMPLKGDVIRSAKNLRFVDIAFTGVDHVDLDACRELHAVVSNASGYSDESVAELAISMMLSLLRNTREAEAALRNGGTKAGLVGNELSGKTVGIVGMGKIGSRVAALLHAFGCKVLACNPRHRVGDAEFTSLEDLFSRSDIVTLHCPLNASTKGLVNEKLISLMKPGALLINAARGPVVDSAALIAALKSKKLRGAGIDVFDVEPPLSPDHPLLQAPNVLATPHIAFATAESMELRAKIVFANLDAFLAGDPVNLVAL